MVPIEIYGKVLEWFTPQAIFAVLGILLAITICCLWTRRAIMRRSPLSRATPVAAPLPVSHYTYISRAKVEGLFAQLPEAATRPVTSTEELGGGPIPGKFTNETGPQPEMTLQRKLARVKHLLNTAPIEVLAGSNQPFHGTMEMRTMVLPVDPIDQVPTEIVWLGTTGSGKLVCLGGSVQHADDSIPAGPYINSGVATLLLALKNAAKETRTHFEPDGRHFGFSRPPSEHSLPTAWDAEVMDVWKAMENLPSVPLRFAAYWLGESQAGVGRGHYDVLLGTPIFVEYAWRE